MKDIVENRGRIGIGRKLNLLGMVVRENGVAWTWWFGVYYLASTLSWSRLSETAFAHMDRLRQKNGVPGLNSATLNAEIWNHWDWSGGGEEWTPSPEWKDSLLEKVLRAHVPTGAEIVEIGPGAGRWTEHLLDGATHLTGIDISESCVALCREKFASHPHAEFRLTDGFSLPDIKDNSIDLIWSFDVFVHINEREVEKYADEFARVLKPQARGVIHHGTIGGKRGGWRSDLTAEKFTEILRSRNLTILEQFTEWEDEGQCHSVGLYEDAITVFEKI